MTIFTRAGIFVNLIEQNSKPCVHTHTVWEKALSHQKWLRSAGKKAAGWWKGTRSIVFQESPINAPSPTSWSRWSRQNSRSHPKFHLFSLIPSLTPLLCIKESTSKTYPSCPTLPRAAIDPLTCDLAAHLATGLLTSYPVSLSSPIKTKFHPTADMSA